MLWTNDVWFVMCDVWNVLYAVRYALHMYIELSMLASTYAIRTARQRVKQHNGRIHDVRQNSICASGVIKEVYYKR